MNTIHLQTISPRHAAIAAGSAILLMAFAAGFAVGYVNPSLIVAEDAAETFQRIKASEMVFRWGIFSWLLILICDIIAAWGLYLYFAPVNKGLSLLTAWLRMSYAAFLGIALLNYVAVLLLLAGEGQFLGGNADHLAATVAFFIKGFQGIWSIGLVIFGCHLLGLGFLLLLSKELPKLLGILVLAAALGYILIHGGEWIVPNFNAYKAQIEPLFVLPMIVGELGLALWLLFKGGKNTSLHVNN